MEAVEELLTWAVKKGVKLSGIRALPLPGRGIGIVSTRKLKKGDILLEVPTSCLKTLETVKYISRKLPKDASVHGRLALDLCLDTTPGFKKWKGVMPRPDDLATMPVLWPEELQQNLPLRARNLLSNQKSKIETDWSIASKAFPSISKDDYIYAWLLVNSRTFYHVTPKTEKLSPDDRMVLQPVADLFNHAASGGCKVSFDEGGFSVVAEREYRPGEEVQISYGRHSNDFLLVEYGFCLAENEWDEVALDDVLLKRLNPRQRDLLEERGYLGEYFVDARTVCYKTEVAAMILCLSTREWLRLVDSGKDLEGGALEEKVEGIITGLVEEMLDEAEAMLKDLRHERSGSKVQRDVLKGRWIQVRGLLLKALESR